MSMVLAPLEPQDLEPIFRYTLDEPDVHLLYVSCPTGFMDFTDFKGPLAGPSHFEACQRLHQKHADRCNCGINPECLEFQID